MENGLDECALRSKKPLFVSHSPPVGLSQGGAGVCPAYQEASQPQVASFAFMRMRGGGNVTNKIDSE